MALGYRENADKFADKNIVVYGMNDKDAESAKAWIEKENLPSRCCWTRTGAWG